ncbi:hypothetical protein WA026_005155 [Henosepilachna vigintioctopunctata]|uniref:CCHC-type domain-containing protein n=1 Tax=Henosepilachna vigintioctopunctata TaxID=420089 RepID=A0AAW1UL26_9CUCU
MEWNAIDSGNPPDPGGTNMDEYHKSTSQNELTTSLLTQSLNLINDKYIENSDFNQVTFDKVLSQSKLALCKKNNTSQITQESILSQEPYLQSQSSNNTNIESTQETRKKSLIKSYDLTDTGPFKIYIESKNENIGSLHPMSLGRILHKNDKSISDNVVDISKLGRNRICVEMRTALSANKTINAEFVKSMNLIAYIPQFLTKRVGVVRNVAVDITESDILEHLNSLSNNNFKVLEVKRMMRRVRNERNELTSDKVPLPIILITFKGQELPDKISIYRYKCSVEPYVQRVIQCFQCLRFGHISEQCRSKHRCKKCGGEHDVQNCEKVNPKCIHCSGNHLSTDNINCSEFLKQKRIKKIMAFENISYKEALTKESNSYASAVRSNSEKTSSSTFTSTRKRRITHYEPNISEQLRKAHNDIISLPNTSNVRGTCINNNIIDDSEKVWHNWNSNNLVSFIMESLNEILQNRNVIGNEEELKKFIYNKISIGSNTNISTLNKSTQFDHFTQ